MVFSLPLVQLCSTCKVLEAFFLGRVDVVITAELGYLGGDKEDWQTKGKRADFHDIFLLRFARVWAVLM